MDSSNSENTELKRKARDEAFDNASEKIPQLGGYFSLNQEFPEYNVKQWNVHLNGNFIGKRITEYKGQFAAVTSTKYNLIPNEKVIEIAQEVIKEHDDWNLMPDKSGSEGKWHIQNGNVIESTGDKKYTPSGCSMLARYRFPDDIDPTGDGSPLHLGVAVGSSIDLSRGFSITPYHYRGSCMNSMYHVRLGSLTKEGTLVWEKAGDLGAEWDKGSTGRLNLENPELQAGADNLSDSIDYLNDTATGMKDYQSKVKHTKKLTPAFIAEMFEHAMETTNTVAKAYGQLSKLKLNKLLANKIANSPLPKGLKDKLDGFRWNVVKDAKGEPVIKSGHEVYEGEFTDVTGKTEDQWQVYNQVTDLLSHGSLTFDSTLNNMGTLDSIFLKPVMKGIAK